MTAVAEIETIMQVHPDLAYIGMFYWPGRHTAEERATQKAEWRDDMLTSHAQAQYERAKQYIEQLQPSVKPYLLSSSYGLKHRAESWHRQRGTDDPYVSNGMFIAAALNARYRICRVDGPNIFINVTKTSVKEAA
jgi:hypothetical protein